MTSMLRTGARDCSERSGLLHDRGLAVRSLVLVDDTFGGGLVELLGSVTTERDRLVLVAGLGGLAEFADGGLQAGLDSLVALVRLRVLLVPLDLALDVGHCQRLWFEIRGIDENLDWSGARRGRDDPPVTRRARLTAGSERAQIVLTGEL